MKKLLGTLFAATLVLSACSQDDALYKFLYETE